MAFDRRSGGKQLADVLAHEGILSKTQLMEAQKLQRSPQDPLAPHIVRCGFLTPWDLAKHVCVHFGLPYFDIQHYTPKKDVLGLLEAPFLHGYSILPVDRFGRALTLTVPEPLAPEVLQSIVDQTQLSPFLYVSPYDQIRQKLEDAVPYEAPTPRGAVQAPGPTAAPAGEPEGDWMSIFEEAEKKMKASDD